MSRFQERLQSFFYAPDEDVSGLLDLGEVQEAEPPQAEEAPEEFLAFGLAGERYLVPLTAVREAVKVPPLTEIPRAAAGLMGVMSLRGQLLPVYDVRTRLGLGPPPPPLAGPEAPPPPRAARVLVVRSEPGDAGLLVDEVAGVVRLRPSTLEPPLPGVVHGERQLVRGLGRLRDALYILLDAEALFAEALFGEAPLA